MSDFLFDITPLVTPTYPEHLSHRARFEAFHSANPWVAVAFERLISAWLRAGHKRVGMKAVAEKIRWEYGATTGDVYRMNNNHVAYYAELMLARHPEWADAIQTRGERAAA